MAAMDRTTHGPEQKVEYHQPGGPQAIVPTLPPLNIRTLDPGGSDEAARWVALQDLLSSLLSTSLSLCDHTNYGTMGVFGAGTRAR